MRMRNATKEERTSVDNYIKSISEPIYSFTQEELKEHDSLVRADVIDELLKILSPCYDCNACEEESKNYFQNSCMSEMLDYEEIVERAKQLKEQK